MLKFRHFNLIMVVGLVMLVGCTSETPEVPTTTITNVEQTQVLLSKTPSSGPTLTLEPTFTSQPPNTPEPTQEKLLVTPQRIEFEAEDGTVLVGYYYPSTLSPAPLIVLMHWARGDQTDWVEIAHWLQNRVDDDLHEGSPSETIISSWLPPMPENLSYAVFTFDFRGFGESKQSGASGNPEGWLMDATAAVDAAKRLPGVDVNRSINIGASIGADGAIDACINECKGALSISPGSYLGIPYSSAVANLDSTDPEALAWCLASEGDTPSSEACHSTDGVNYMSIIYPGRAHGMDLFKPGLELDIGQVLQDFIFLSLGRE